MLTLFSIPKPFHGHSAVIQRNALESWVRVLPREQILLCGDDQGVAETAKEFGVRYGGSILKNEYGTPLLHDLFKKAALMTSDPWLCYVNADILLMSDLLGAVERTTHWQSLSLLVGQRWDLEITVPLVFSDQWEQELRIHLTTHGRLHPKTGMDYFVFPRDVWGSIPPFAIGRTAWDNWLIYRARTRGVPVIDATQGITAIHQNHDYAHAGLSPEALWKGPEAKRNLQLAGGTACLFTLADATHRLTDVGPQLLWNFQSLRRHLATWSLALRGRNGSD